MSPIIARQSTFLGVSDHGVDLGLPSMRRPGAWEADCLSRLAAGRLLVKPSGNRGLLYRAAKRALDIAGGLVLLVALSPVMLLTWLALLITTRGRPLYAQQRVGHCGQPFRMLKFRTMRPDADRCQHLIENEACGPVFKNRRDPRVTRLGRLLRALSIDETPQLFHVLSGKMSLVGPRPLPTHEVARCEPWQHRRLSVKPGLTCLWQVSGRCEMAFDDWVRMDLWYVENQSLAVDLRLLARTPGSVLGRRGAY